jgi:hypothetical protein
MSLARARLMGAAILIVVLGVACGGNAPSPSASTASVSKPTVVLQSPVNGAVFTVGQNVPVSGGASDTVGVDHVALFADGVSVASSPAGQPAPLVPFSLTWLATPAGPHVLQVVAYRADGTASDPAVANVVVGGGSFPVVSGSSLPPLLTPRPTSGGLITPAPTKKPKPTQTPTPTTAPTLASTAPTDTPAPTETASPTPTATPLPTPDASGQAPDDATSEPHIVLLDPANAAQCPVESTGIPTSAIGCVWEQLSAPAGDSTDEIDFTVAPNTEYKIQLTSCSDTSDQTVFLTAEQAPGTVTGCGDWQVENGGAAERQQMVVLTFSTAPAQVYNLYQFTVYQCEFANCTTQ